MVSNHHPLWWHKLLDTIESIMKDMVHRQTPSEWVAFITELKKQLK